MHFRAEPSAPEHEDALPLGAPGRPKRAGARVSWSAEVVRRQVTVLCLALLGALGPKRASAEEPDGAKTRAGVVIEGLKLGSYGPELDGLERSGQGELAEALEESGVIVHRRAEPRDVVLSGRVQQVLCTSSGGDRCGLDIEFALFDPSSERPLYRTRVRHVEVGIGESSSPGASARLVRSAGLRLAQRERFQEAIEQARSNPYAEEMPSRSIRRCEAVQLSLPGDSPRAIAATALVRTGVGTGSAVVISPDGYLLTAAHVVGKAQNVVVRRKDGREVKARVVRLDTDADVALLAVESPAFFSSCLGVDATSVDVGRDVYAVGAPAGEELSFSISRGIVSGVRTIAGRSYLQTDASINPGNSGGPLLDAGGRVLGVVSWKLADTALEGLGFAVPVSIALESLALEWGEASSAELKTEKRRAHVTRKLVVDPADPPFDFAPAAAPEDSESRHAWAPPVLGAGILLGVVGATTGIVALATVSSNTSYSDRQAADTWAAIGFSTAGVGAAAILTAILVPALSPSDEPARTTSAWRVTPLVGPTLGVHVSY